MIYRDKVSFKRIEAVHWTGMNIYEIATLVGVYVDNIYRIADGGLRIHTRNGVVTVQKDGYIIKHMESGMRRIVTVGKEFFERRYEKENEL